MTYDLFYFRQTRELDFRKLPDPFGSYRYQLKPEDLNYSSGKALKHIEDPEMQSLMQREITRLDIVVDLVRTECSIKL